MTDTPQQRVDYYVGSHIRHAERIGVKADEAEIRSGTARLLEAADAEIRNRAGTTKDRDGKTNREALDAKRAVSAEALAEQAGVEFFYRDEREESLITKPTTTEIPRGLDGEKHIALIARVGILMRRVPNYRLKPGEGIYAAFVYPWYAQALTEHTKNAALTDARSHGVGHYAGRPIADRQRMYYAQLERICNKSDAVLGRGWWIPK